MAINYQGYFDANPDVYRQYQQNNYGMSPEQYAQFHYDNYGKAEGRYMPTWVNSASTSTTQATTPTAAATTRQSPTLAQQILASSDPTKWQGEGFGSAQANAEDMAKILSGIGITDIGQLAQRTVHKGGEYYESEGQGFNMPEYDVTEYYNKDTGQALGNTYGERQIGNAWGGTYAGSGNTAYRVQYDAQGNPHFYTTGASSKTDLSDLAPVLGIASMAFGWPGLLGGAVNSGLGLGLGAAGEVALGGALAGGGISGLAGGDVLKGAALGGLGGYVQGSGGIDGLLGNTSNDFFPIGGPSGTTLTPAAIESGLGTAGYGFNAGAAASGLFDPSLIGAGAGGSFEPTYTTPSGDYYSNEGRNYPTPDSTQGTGGSPVNASLSTPGGLPLVTVNPPTTTTPTTTTTTTPDLKTVTDIAKVVTTVGGLLGGGALVNNALGGGGGSNVSPTQSVPVGNQDYYNAIQQYYNAYLPTQPRDVATPLQNWYSKKYGA